MQGKKISHYQIVERLGEGGMGVVYRAHDDRLDRDVAVKFLSPELGRDPTAKERFVQEAKAASALDHPNICAIYDIGETDEGQMYMVQALYDGHPLEELVRVPGLPAGDVIDIALQIAGGLAKAHARGIVHRDIKPSNVIATSDGMMKILDFGLAKMVGSGGLTKTGHSVGTPSFMAPEQITGEAVDARADVWSIGVILFELLTGRRPFQGENIQAIWYAVVNQEPPAVETFRPDVTPELSAIVERCLQKDAAERYADAGEVEAALRDAKRSLPDDQLGVGDYTTIVTGSPSTARAKGTDPPPVTADTITARTTAQRAATAGRRTARGIVVTLIVVFAAIGAVWTGYRVLRPGPTEGTRVLVWPSRVESADTTDAATIGASALDVAVLHGLLSLENVTVLEPPRSTRLDADPGAVAAQLATDDIVIPALADRGGEWQATLKRIRAGDGSVAWTGDVAVAKHDPLAFEQAVGVRLREAFRDHEPREGMSVIDVKASDYERYLLWFNKDFYELALSPDAGNVLEILRGIRRTSPRFVDAYLAEARMRAVMFDHKIALEGLDEARRLVARAREIAPDDPRVASLRFDIARLLNEENEVAAALGELRRLEPGSIDVTFKEAIWAARRGDVDRALELLREVVARRPARDYLSQLASLEYEQGHIADAQSHLHELIERFPDYTWPRSKLAELELLYGSAERAEALFARLVDEEPTANRITNLGLAQQLLGKYDAAANQFEGRISAAPDDHWNLLNLADCEKLRRRTERADSLYRRVLEIIRDNPGQDTWGDLMVVAQCKAHLGETGAALVAIQDALAAAPDNPEVLYAAALVYTLVGQNEAALVNAQRAHDKGVQGVWFSLPWFEPLRGNPDFQTILNSRSVAAGPVADNGS